MAKGKYSIKQRYIKRIIRLLNIPEEVPEWLKIIKKERQHEQINN